MVGLATLNGITGILMYLMQVLNYFVANLQLIDAVSQACRSLQHSTRCIANNCPSSASSR